MNEGKVLFMDLNSEMSLQSLVIPCFSEPSMKSIGMFGKYLS